MRKFTFLSILLIFILMTGAALAQDDANKALVGRAAELYSAGSDAEALAGEIFAPGFRLHMLDMQGTPVQDIASYLADIRTALAAMPDLTFTPLLTIAEGDKVAQYGQWGGTFTGAYGDGGNSLPPTNQPVRINSFSIYRIEDGKIAEAWRADNVFTRAQQLGILPVEGEIPQDPVFDVTPGAAAAPPETLRQVIERQIQGVSYNIPEVFDEVYADGAIIYDIDGPKNGAADMKDWLSSGKTTFPNHTFFIKDVVTEGGLAFVRFETVGTFINNMGDIPANGATLVNPGISLYQFKDGKILKEWWMYDLLGFLQMLMAPPA